MCIPDLASPKCSQMGAPCDIPGFSCCPGALICKGQACTMCLDAVGADCTGTPCCTGLTCSAGQCKKG